MHTFTSVIKYISLVFATAVVLCGATACSSDKKNEPDAPDKDATRTVLVYMIADNSLGSLKCDEADISEMRQAAATTGFNGGRLLVYHNRRGTASGKVPVLLEIRKNSVDTLRFYPDDPTVYSTDTVRMREVFADMKRFAPASDYGLVLWSHGSGWTEGTGARSPQKRAFGEDRKRNMKVTSLARALYGQGFSFVYFDCCLMGTVEVAYELRHAAPVIVASGTELPLPGMPYDENLQYLFATPQAKLTEAARNTFEWYGAQEDGSLRCSMTAIRTAGLDALAEATRRVFAEAFTDFETDFSDVQPYDRPGVVTCTLWDMEDYIETMLASRTLLPAERRSRLLADWRAALAGCVDYAEAHSRILGDLTVKRYCGLGSYVVAWRSDADYRGYKNQSWWKDVVSTAPAFAD